MANSIGLPMLVAGGPAVEAVPEARTVILDAHAGRLHVTPDARQLAEAEHTIARDRERREAERIAAQREARTADGRRVHVFANLGSPADTTAAVALGAEGCGLLRTEFLFLDRRTPPTEDEQLATYQRIAAGLDGRPLTIRTLDVGGDKPIDYLPLPAEDNPALGLRGVRTSLWRPELLQQQLRAILRVRPAGQSRILLPMITDAGEIETVRAELASAMSALGIERAPALGVMIETPAAAVLADTLAPQVDFFSVGTNDLTQYALAMDRGHPELAPRLDGLHPAVLRLVATAAQAARAHGREIAVCGNLGSDLQAVPLLIGLGIDELSVAHAAVPAVKARIAALEFDACRALATRALECSTADQVRALVSA
jgi:phosphocarrier protein FPr/phosphocarrier protein